MFRTSGYGVRRYLPVIASLPEGKDPKEAINEATKVSLPVITRFETGMNPIIPMYNYQGANRRRGSHRNI